MRKGRLRIVHIAVLACGRGAALSHLSAGALWRLIPLRDGPVAVVVGTERRVKRPGIRVHRRAGLSDDDLTEERGIRVTNPATTLIDLAASVTPGELEVAVNEADMRGLCKLGALREALDATPPRPGVGALRRLIGGHAFRLTRSELERLFIPIAERAGLGRPLTREYVNGFEVDFHWPDLGLVVETDSLRFHRTAEAQLKDRIRDQTHTAAGLTTLRFTHHQVAHTPDAVVDVLQRTARRLAA